MPERVSTVLFDLDETLCDYTRSSAELLELAFEAASVDPCFDVGDYHEIAERYKDEAESKAERRARSFADLAESAGRERAVGRAVAAEYADLRDHGNVSASDGLDATLSALGDDYRIGIVTNGEPAMQDPKLDSLGLWEYVGTVVYAGSETPAKPATDPFERGLDALDTIPDETVFVGNSIETDVLGANRAGLTTVWIPLDRDVDADGVPESGPRRPDYRVDELTAVEDEPWD